MAPGNIVTPMTADVVSGDHTDLETAHDPHREFLATRFQGRPWPVDIANVALFLASDEAAYVNGHTLVADAGQTTGIKPIRRAEPPLEATAGRAESPERRPAGGE